MRHKMVLLASIFGLISGCAAVKEPDKKANTASFKGENGQAFVAGFQPANVSLIIGGKKVDADCTIDSTKFVAMVHAPGKVNLPAYSHGAVNALLTCEYEGTKHSGTFEPINLSKQARSESSVAIGILLCPICGVGMAVGNKKKSGDIFGFSKMELKV